MGYLNILQELNNLLFSIFGSAGFIISFQAYINTKHHKKDKVDKKQIIHVDENLNEYVQ